ncbi:hypothetical protein EVAR_11038_1 [Eumeta japonica]|uniref:Uncharacterized protein n=1 Tax=Eumeta variegata TaxID=151549 RepID=A0A4C1U4F6_EUMVA|nr:hypothetical protein EVAR_11038_1 [Eumeta japonica]
MPSHRLSPSCAEQNRFQLVVCLSHCPFVNLLACTYSPTTYSRLPGPHFGCAASLCAHLVSASNSGLHQGFQSTRVRAFTWNGSVASLSDAFGVSLNNLVELVARAHRFHHLGGQSPFIKSSIHGCCELGPSSLCRIVDSCTRGRGPDRPSTRTANVTALWSEDVTSRTTCHSSALSSRAGCSHIHHALEETIPYTPRTWAYCPRSRCAAPQNREVAEIDTRASLRSLPHHTLHALTSPPG